MLMLVVMVTALGAVLIGLFRTSAAAHFVSDRQSDAALAQARDALIGYAANANQPGVLPCPDNDNDGSADSPCGATGVTAVGRLPWKTLGLPDLRDGAGECLWYAVSANFKNSGTSGPAVVNSNSAGTLIVNDASGNPMYSGANAVLAVVFAPGSAIGNQDRTAGAFTVCGGNTTVANYLEGGNENGVATNTYVTGQVTTTYNDRLLPITHDVLFAGVEARVAREIRAVLAAYYGAYSYYPYASNFADVPIDGHFNCDPTKTSGALPGVKAGYGIPVGCTALMDWVTPPPGWFTANYWHQLTYYTVAPECTQPTPGCAAGSLQVNTVSGPKALVIVAGRALTGQSRPCASVADCLEGGNQNGTATNAYFKNPVSVTFNDKIIVVAP